MSAIVNIHDRVVKQENGCWIWQGTISNGYGIVKRKAATPSGWTTVGVHVLAWQALHGSVPAGFELDHQCRNRACCNPDHLEPVTRRQNLLRSPLTAAGKLAARTHCPRGHLLAGDNLKPSEPTRACRACARARCAAYNQKLRARREAMAFVAAET